MLENENDLVSVIPTSMKYVRSKVTRNYDRFALSLRELGRNAIQYGAEEGCVFCLTIDGNRYLGFCHNGEPFKNIEEMCDALKPCKSALRGRNGQGMKIAALLNESNYTELIVASRTKESNGEFKVAKFIPYKSPEPCEDKVLAKYLENLFKRKNKLKNKIPDSVVYLCKTSDPWTSIDELSRNLTAWYRFLSNEIKIKIIPPVIGTENFPDAHVHDTNDDRASYDVSSYDDFLRNLSLTFKTNIYECSILSRDKEITFKGRLIISVFPGFSYDNRYISIFGNNPTASHHHKPLFNNIFLRASGCEDESRIKIDPIYAASRSMESVFTALKMNYKNDYGNYEYGENPEMDLIINNYKNSLTKNENPIIKRKPFLVLDYDITEIVGIKIKNEEKENYYPHDNKYHTYADFCSINDYFTTDEPEIAKNIILSLSDKIISNKDGEYLKAYKEYEKYFPNNKDNGLAHIIPTEIKSSHYPIIVACAIDPKTGRETECKFVPKGKVSNVILHIGNKNGPLYDKDDLVCLDGSIKISQSINTGKYDVEISDYKKIGDPKDLSLEEYIDLPRNSVIPKRYPILVSNDGTAYEFHCVEVPKTCTKNKKIDGVKNKTKKSNGFSNQFSRILNENIKFDYDEKKYPHLFINSENKEICRIFSSDSNLEIKQKNLYEKLKNKAEFVAKYIRVLDSSKFKYDAAQSITTVYEDFSKYLLDGILSSYLLEQKEYIEINEKI